ncbi:hypothetical protein ElP_77000 (plasmid) [Tautonia plasticadhaerens]|uniref:Uncharacterized protein n=1 Tax=Tautonia plasticadhaerens TaxID=2527974 RepID=A0A518HG01_9BACT|nr:hypothetical protein ElP_77000 [Tautonia plasticadhaerens]
MWENLLGRPVISDIADAYRPAEPDVMTSPTRGISSNRNRLMKALLPVANCVFYEWT